MDSDINTLAFRIRQNIADEHDRTRATKLLDLLHEFMVFSDILPLEENAESLGKEIIERDLVRRTQPWDGNAGAEAATGELKNEEDR